jgi:hypothetical protein
MTYQVKSRFQSLPFKFNLQRYTTGNHTFWSQSDDLADVWVSEVVGLRVALHDAHWSSLYV